MLLDTSISEVPCVNITLSGPHAVDIQYHGLWEPAGCTSGHMKLLNKKLMVQVQGSEGSK
jgi:hypothetical protein